MFLRYLPLQNRGEPTLKIARIILNNYRNKAIGRQRLFTTLPIMGQAYGAGKTIYLKNLSNLIQKYCANSSEFFEEEKQLLKEIYYIYVDLRISDDYDEPIKNKINAMIFKSFLESFDLDNVKFPESIELSSLDLLFRYIIYKSKEENFKVLLKKLYVEDNKIAEIVEKIKNEKYSMIFIEFDEIKRMETEIYNEKEEKIIENRAKKDESSSKGFDYINLHRLYFFWEKMSYLYKEKNVDIIFAGKGCSALIGRRILSVTSPTWSTQINLNPLKKEHVVIWLK